MLCANASSGAAERAGAAGLRIRSGRAGLHSLTCPARGLRIPAMIAFFTLLAAVLGAPPATQPTGKVVRFAEGVSIDWGRKQVEIDSQVVLRDGVLELLACSRGTKEHESILQIRARPQNVYQALGMLGLPDGQPPRFDE